MNPGSSLHTAYWHLCDQVRAYLIWNSAQLLGISHVGREYLR